MKTFPLLFILWQKTICSRSKLTRRMILMQVICQTLRKSNSEDSNLWWSEWMVFLCGINEFGNSSDYVFRGICECHLVYQNLNFLLQPNRAIPILKSVIDTSHWITIIGSFGKSILMNRNDFTRWGTVMLSVLCIYEIHRNFQNPMFQMVS